MLSICGYIFLLFVTLCIILSTLSEAKEKDNETSNISEAKQNIQQSNLVTYYEWKKLQSNSTTIKPWVKPTYQTIRLNYQRRIKAIDRSSKIVPNISLPLATKTLNRSSTLRPSQISTIPSNLVNLADTRITLSHFDRRTEKVYKKEIFENNKDYLCHLKALESRRKMQNEYNKKHGTEKFEEADTPGLFFCDIPEGMSPSMIIYCTGAAILWLVLFGTFSFDRIRQILARLRPFFANNNNNNGLNANRDNNQNIQMVQIV